MTKKKSITTDSLAFLTVTSQEIFCFFRSLRRGETNQLTILQLCHMGAQVGLTSNQKMIFSLESANLDQAYIYHDPLI